MDAAALTAELDAIEGAFGAEALEVTARRLKALEAVLPPSGPIRARWLVDAAVVTHLGGDATGATGLLETALIADPGCVDALDNLADLATTQGALRHVLGVRLRLARLIPGDAGRELAVAVAARACGEWPLAREAAERARALDRSVPGLAALDAELETRPVAAPALERPGRLLIGVEHFFPSSGGSERLAEDAAVALRDLGWDVAIVTGPHPERRPGGHRGLPVFEVRPGHHAADLAAAVAAHRADAILSFAFPLAWPVLEPLALPHPRPRAVVVPCVNGDADVMLREVPARLRSYHALLAGAGAVGHSSLGMLDARLAHELGFPPAYVPNAVIAAAPDPGVLGRAGLAPGEPFLLCVGNMWPEKNHAGLLAHLAAHDDDLPLVHVGTPSAAYPELGAEIAAAAARDPRVRLFGAGTREEVAGLMAAAGALLLPSHVEATPLVVLEAMSHGLPWIATPECGAVHEHEGGRIVPLEDFLPTARALLADEPARRALGAAGREHWAACYTWDAIAPRYDALLRGARELPPLMAPRERALAA
jgi:glycosyltransferase involved in cell wall biosynthesis